MADLQKYRAHESLAVDTAADWQVQSAVTADADGVAVNVTGYHTVHLQSDNDFYYILDNLLNEYVYDLLWLPIDDCKYYKSNVFYVRKLNFGI